MKIVNKGNELDKQLEQLFQLAQHIRAPFLEQAIFIEKLIEDIIAKHFCPEEERRTLFFSLVINGTELTFSSKIDILDRLLQLCYPIVVKSYPQLINEIQKIRRFRNRVAHALLDTSETFLSHNYNDRIQLIYYEDGQTKQQVVMTTEIEERLRECTKVVKVLVEIQEKITKRESSSETLVKAA